MIAAEQVAGPSRIDAKDAVIATPHIRVEVDDALCATLTDVRRGRVLSRFCPAVGRERDGLTMTKERTERLYGLGQAFAEPGTDPSWLGRIRRPGGPHGNAMVPFHGGKVGDTQIPVLYALGGARYALFLDEPAPLTWDFRDDPWTVRVERDAGAPIRWYVAVGETLPELRAKVMALLGRPPVPPKRAFGLFISEYGYDDWTELRSKIDSLRKNRFPVDAAVLDLQWFGGIESKSEKSRMGALTFDLQRFPEPKKVIAELEEKRGIAVVPIEESYVSRGLPAYRALADAGFLVRARRAGEPADFESWWGSGGMIDWTSRKAGDFWHDQKRQALVELGVLGHWTDLGEPEDYDPNAWYVGFEDRHDDLSAHNLYNLLWSQSIVRGYERHDVVRRPLILSRSGTAGSQRFGVAMWSGDIGSNFASLAGHIEAQANMSLSGIDYYGADIGGFRRESLDGELGDLYTRWFAAGALLDVPVRVHTENLCNCKETSPDRAGDLASNRANIRLRYSLIPYLYSLAHRAHRFGEPLFSPLSFVFEEDSQAAERSHQKMIGRDLLMAASTIRGEDRLDVYLPSGLWFDFRTGETTRSTGQVVKVPLWKDGLFELPLYARAGAVVPMMPVDDETWNAFGRRSDGTHENDLKVRVFPGDAPSETTLYEDDGTSVAYLAGAVRTTRIAQAPDEEKLVVTVYASEGTYTGASDVRDTWIELATGAEVTAVALDDRPLKTRARPDGPGWVRHSSGFVTIRTGRRPVSETQRIRVTFGRSHTK